MTPVTIDIEIESGTYTVSFSEDAESPQNLVVKDGNAIRGLARDEIAQLYAIQESLHDLGDSSNATLSDKISSGHDDLTQYYRHLLESDNALIWALEQKLQCAKDELDQKTIDRLTVFGDTLANAATLGAAQLALTAFLGIAAAPIGAVSLGILAVSSAISAWNLVQSERDNSLIIILADQALRLSALSLGSNTQPGLKVALEVLDDLVPQLVGYGTNSNNESMRSFSLDDFIRLQNGKLAGEAFGRATVEFAMLIASIDGCEANEASDAALDSFARFIAGVTPTNMDDGLFVVVDLISSIGAFLTEHFPSIEEQAISLGEKIDKQIQALENLSAFSNESLVLLEELARSYIVQGTPKDDVILASVEKDTIRGGDGNDTLTGGEGADIFLGTFAELDGDIITDLEVGDRIFVEGVTLGEEHVSADQNGITISSSGLTSRIEVNTIENSGLHVSSGISLNGSSGTWLDIQREAAFYYSPHPKVDVSYDQNGQLIYSRVVRYLTDAYGNGRDPVYAWGVENTAAFQTDLAGGEGQGYIQQSRDEIYDLIGRYPFKFSSDYSINIEHLRDGVFLASSGNFRGVSILANREIPNPMIFIYGNEFKEIAIEGNIVGSIFNIPTTHAFRFRDSAVDQIGNVYVLTGGTIHVLRSINIPNSYTNYSDIEALKFSLFIDHSDLQEMQAISCLSEGEMVGVRSYGDRSYFSLINGLEGTVEELGFLDIPFVNDFVYNGSLQDFQRLLSGNTTSVTDTNIPEIMVIAEQSVEGVGGALSGEMGNTRLNGSNGDDTLTDTDGHNQFDGGNGDDVMRSGDGNDVHSGGTGSDDIESGSGNDYVDGGADNDRIADGDGHDLLIGGTGADVIILEGSGHHGSEYVAFNVSSDTQVGTQERVRLEGLVRIEAVTDCGEGFDTIRLSNEADAFFLHDAFSGFHSLVDLEDDYIGRDSAARFTGTEAIKGLGGNDIIDLTSPDYSLAGRSLAINGGFGKDIIWGSDADETISGGAGNDTIFGGTGNDIMSGGFGADVFEFTRTSTNTTIADFDLLEGDSLRFYNTGGAEFLADSAALTDTGGQISYVDIATGQTHVLDIAITFENRDDYPHLGSLSDVFEII